MERTCCVVYFSDSVAIGYEDKVQRGNPLACEIHENVQTFNNLIP